MIESMVTEHEADGTSERLSMRETMDGANPSVEASSSTELLDEPTSDGEFAEQAASARASYTVEASAIVPYDSEASERAVNEELSVVDTPVSEPNTFTDVTHGEEYESEREAAMHEVGTANEALLDPSASMDVPIAHATNDTNEDARTHDEVIHVDGDDAVPRASVEAVPDDTPAPVPVRVQAEMDDAAVMCEDVAVRDPHDTADATPDENIVTDVAASVIGTTILSAVPSDADGTATLASQAQPTPTTVRRNRRSSSDDSTSDDQSSEPSSPPVASDADQSDDRGAIGTDTSDMHSVAAAMTPLMDTGDDACWRDLWPDNEVQIVGRLLPRATDAPTLDGVLRVRMEVALVEQYDGEFGSIGNLPIFILPDAPGFGPIYREVRRASRYNPHAQPMMVELRGILRQLVDRDPRYVTERFTVLMGVEVHRVSRAAPNAEQYAFWRGRATVRYVNSYKHKGQPYRRVTAVVSHKQRKPRLRGVSVMHIPVDFLVAWEHEHADRFGRVDQPLLIEANIASDVYRIKDTHPSLEGLEPECKSQLQVQRDAIVTVTLGEFPNALAEADYRRWVKAGRPFPQRSVPKPLVSNATASSVAPSAQGAAQNVVASEGVKRDQDGRAEAARDDTPSKTQRRTSHDTSAVPQHATSKKQPRGVKEMKTARSRAVRDTTG